MRDFLSRLVFALLLALVATFAHSQNTVTGTIQDSNGNPYANGTASAVTVPTSGLAAKATTPIATNSAGFFTLSLPSNTYVFTLCAPPTSTGPLANPTPKQVCFSSGPIAIAGSVDLSSTLNPLAALLGPGTPPILSATVSTLPLASLNTSRLYRVTDGQNSGDCTSGGGSSTALCISNGAAWVATGAGASVGGLNTQVQFNNSGSFAGDATLTHTIATGETDVANFDAHRYVTASYKFSYVDSGGSLGNLTAAGAGLVVTLPCSGAAPCPVGLDASGGSPYALTGTGSITSGQFVVTETSGVFFSNMVGHTILIPTAGPTGGTLTSTIVSWQSSTQVTIATAATATVSGQTISVGSYDYKVKISGTGTTEAAMVTGGTCTARGTASCTLILSTQFNHPNGYTISSASDGIQEAINDAWTNDTPLDATSSAAPSVKTMAGVQYNIYGSVYVRGRGSKLDLTGSLLGCFTRDYCIYVGNWRGHPNTDHQVILNPFFAPGLSATDIVGCSGNTYCNVSGYAASSNVITITTSANHSFHGPTNGVGADVIACEVTSTGRASRFVGVIQSVTANTFTFALEGSGTFSNGTTTFGFCRPLTTAIEDNGEHVLIDNMRAQQINSVNASPSAVFGYGVTNENDQHAMFQKASAGGIVDTTYPVSAFYYQRTDRGYSGIMNIVDAELSNMNCYTGGGNGMTWMGGVCQGFPVFGVRYFGGLQPATIGNVYQESSSATTNPLYGYGAAMAYLLSGSSASHLLGTFPVGGVYATFPCSGTAQAQRNYYVIPYNDSLQQGPMTYIGSSQANCAGATIPVTWPNVLQDTGGATTITWSLLVTSGVGTTIPIGTTNTFLLFQSSSPTCGNNGMCTFSDTQGAPTSHTLTGTIWAPTYWFWPSSIVANGTGIYADLGSSRGLVSSQGQARTAMIAYQCIAAGSDEQMSQSVTECLDGNSGSSQLFAHLAYQVSTGGQGATANTKGFLNFGPETPNLPADFLTFVDSNWQKTISTLTFRPANDAADCALGEDQSGGLTVRCATSFSQYINTANDNSSFKERLTATQKTFTVPITVTQGTITTSNPFMNHTVTWNAGGVAFTDFLSNITCTAAATASIAAGWGTAGTQWQLKYAAANCGTPQMLSPSGTAAAPAYSGSAASNSGLFFTNNANTSLSANSVAMMNWNQSTLATQMGSNQILCWNNASGSVGTCDTWTSRSAAGVWAFGAAAAVGDTTGKLKAAGYMSAGTTFTSNAGCTESALTGGATAGKFTVGQATACTIVITMGNSATAPNGWACWANDQTAVPAVAIRQTASTTTTASLLMTVATNDVVSFGCLGY